MAADLDLKITVISNDSSNGKRFNFRGVALKAKKSQPAIPIPFISSTPANTILFRFFGQIEVVTFSFAILGQ